MEYLEANELEAPGVYWWLPECNRGQSGDPASWTVKTWHPADPTRPKSGLLYGPLPAPVFPPGVSPKLITFIETAAKAGVILNSGNTWEEIYDQIFCDQVAQKITKTGVDIGEYYDPDSSCERDCRAYVEAITKKAMQLKERFQLA